MSDEPIKIKITFEEVERVVLSEPTQPLLYTPSPTGAGTKSYGRIASAPSVTAGGATGGSLLMKAWFYLGLAGLLGAFLAWAMCEPFQARAGASGRVMFPLMVILMSFGFVIAESAVERSAEKAIQKGILAIVLGTVLGIIFFSIAIIVYKVLLREVDPKGYIRAFDEKNPILWAVRGIAWAVFGVAGGIVYGVVDRSGKKCLYGVLGGAVGAGLGGFLFDPIALLTATVGLHGVARGVGLMILGAGTGIAIGLVESALKDRWLYVSGGPLAGKQFILYKPQTQIGSQQSADIYLFKDPAILPAHALIELRGAQSILHSMGQVFVSGQSAQPQHVLKSGDVIEIGRYTFNFLEKQRTQ